MKRISQNSKMWKKMGISVAGGIFLAAALTGCQMSDGKSETVQTVDTGKRQKVESQIADKEAEAARQFLKLSR